MAPKGLCEEKSKPIIPPINDLGYAQARFSFMLHECHVEISPVWGLDMETHECCDKEGIEEEIGASGWIMARGVSLRKPFPFLCTSAPWKWYFLSMQILEEIKYWKIYSAFV